MKAAEMEVGTTHGYTLSNYDGRVTRVFQKVAENSWVIVFPTVIIGRGHGLAWPTDDTYIDTVMSTERCVFV